MFIKEAKKLALYTEQLAATEHWGVDDQDLLEWLISQAEENSKLKVLINRAIKRLSMPIKQIRCDGFRELMSDLREYERKSKCSSCANGFNGKNGNGYQPCGCDKT